MRIPSYAPKNIVAGIVQLEEHRPSKPTCGGSSPSTRAKYGGVA